LRRVAFIRASQRLGIPLARIKGALDTLPAGRTPTPADWAGLSAAWRQDLDDRIRELQDLRDRLAGCIGCGCLSLTGCELANPGDMLSKQGPGPRALHPGDHGSALTGSALPGNALEDCAFEDDTLEDGVLADGALEDSGLEGSLLELAAD
jgi:MerR family transcriptional regulator, redox-sensitive transcriptional activator SoxR